MSDASPQDQVPQLMDILAREKHWQARRQALDQLLRIGAPAVPALLQALETAEERQFSPWNREVIEALGRLREPRAVEALILVLAQEDPHLRQEAAQALGPLVIPGPLPR
jgi:HEAT repeat protein